MFSDGCFWHGCSRCYNPPTTSPSFWRNKVKNNKERRMKVRRYLRKNGWKIFEFWEHDVNDHPEKIARTITDGFTAQ